MIISDLHKKYQNQKLDYWKAQQILYCDKITRENRFEAFIALYDATLKYDPALSFKVFREAYCASDNIYEKVKNNLYLFNLKKFVKSVKKQNIDFGNIRNSYEKKFYEGLENEFMIYRGISQNEYHNRDYGISWSLSKEEAKNYIWFGPNKVKNYKGGVISKRIKKTDIVTTFSVFENMTDNEPKNEIIYINQGSEPEYEKVNKP